MLEQLKDIFEEELGCDPAALTPESKLREDLGVSSLEMLAVILALEERFSITVDENEVPNLHTFQDVADYVGRLCQAH